MNLSAREKLCPTSKSTVLTSVVRAYVKMVQKDKIIESSQPDSEANPVATEAVADNQVPVDELSIGLERTGQRKFITGVVEGELSYKYKILVVNCNIFASSVSYQHDFCYMWSVCVD